MKITLEQVAKKSNLSTGTVSMALRNDPRIKESTRKYVFELAQRLNYVPSALGRSLATQRTQILGLTITDITNPFFTEVFKGVEDMAVKNGYSVILSNTEYDLKRETEILKIFLEGRVDGLIIDPVENNTDFVMLKQLKRMGIPFVLLRKLKGLEKEYDYVMADDKKGAIILTQHLINMGHMRIGYIGSTQCGVTDHDRFLGYKQALAKAGIEFDAGLVTSHDSFSLSEGLKIGQKLLQERKDIDAIVAFNDLLALGVMEAAYSLGLRVPEDL
ncbi:MAG: LacI family DNA-binding transcriptional regulator, partial [Candidatus Omnitrophota bacterium]|nr:LacI family DNA-binding transcriptional regulator [Candidatus Omnitrophota bacterium]